MSSCSERHRPLPAVRRRCMAETAPTQYRKYSAQCERSAQPGGLFCSVHAKMGRAGRAKSWQK